MTFCLSSTTSGLIPYNLLGSENVGKASGKILLAILQYNSLTISQLALIDWVLNDSSNVIFKSCKLKTGSGKSAGGKKVAGRWLCEDSNIIRDRR